METGGGTTPQKLFSYFIVTNYAVFRLFLNHKLNSGFPKHSKKNDYITKQKSANTVNLNKIIKNLGWQTA